MRLLAAALLCLAYLTIAPEPVWAQAGEKKTPAGPSDTMIIAMAQQFVLEHFERRPEDYFDIAFDIVKIYPQPEPDYWAVVGGFMSDSGNKNYKPHAFGVAIRLICADHGKPKCWQPDKLVIDQKIILNN